MWYYIIEGVINIKKFICFLSLLLMLCSCTNKEEIIIQQGTLPKEQEEIIIEIKGAVKIPGLYTSYKGVLLFEIINQAGGTLNNADMSRINLVQIFNNNSSTSFFNCKDVVQRIYDVVVLCPSPKYKYSKNSSIYSDGRFLIKDGTFLFQAI